MERNQSKTIAFLLLSALLIVSVALALILVNQKKEDRKVLEMIESEKTKESTPSITEQMKEVM